MGKLATRFCGLFIKSRQRPQFSDEHNQRTKSVWSAATGRRFHESICCRTRRLAALNHQDACDHGRILVRGIPGSKLPLHGQ
jgi:hypothetical protein